MAKTLPQIITEVSQDIISNFSPVVVDTRIGTVIYEAIVNPFSSQIKDQDDRIDTIVLNQSIANAAIMSQTAMDALAANYGVIRFGGSAAVGYQRFVKFVAPTGTISIPSGTRVATRQTNSSPQRIFRTLSSASLTNVSPPDPITGAAAYVDVFVEADGVGDAGNVDSGTVVDLLDPITGIDRTFNPAAFNTGSQLQSNAEMAAVIQARAQGRLGTRSGYKDLVTSNFPTQDVLVVSAGDPGMTRNQFGGAVDIVVLGENNVGNSQSYVYSGQTLLKPSILPLALVTSLTGFDGVGNPLTFVGPVGGIGAGTDYDVNIDTFSPFSGSMSENSRIVLHFTTATPGTGTNLTLNYETNQLIRTIQSFVSADTNVILGSDVLVRAGVQIRTNVTAQIAVIPGYDVTTVLNAATAAVQDFSNSRLLGINVQESDIITVIGDVAGVDFVDIPSFVFALSTAPATPVQQVHANSEQYIRIPTITITQL